MKKIFWRWHTSGQKHGDRRVWREDWAGDAFEVVDFVHFDHVRWFCDKFGIPLEEAEDD